MIGSNEFSCFKFYIVSSKASSKSSTNLSKTFMSVPSASITKGITFTLMFHRFFRFLIITIIICIILLLAKFHNGVYSWNLSDSKSPQVSSTLLSILVNLNNAVVPMISIRSPISNSSNCLTKPLGTVPRATITIGITVTFMLLSIFISLAGCKYLSLLLLVILLFG